MKFKTITLSIVLIVSYLTSQDKSIHLNDLVKFNVVDTTGGHYYELATVYYNANLATVFNSLDSNSTGNSYRLISTKLKNDSKEIFYIDFCECYSHDPLFYIYQFVNGKKIQLNSISAESIKIPGDGYIYFNGRKNDYFDRSSKYTFDGNKFIEIVQPFYHVGVRSRVTKIMSLYYDEQLTKPIAVLGKRSRITVLLSKTNNLYLIKTLEGIVGWVKIENANHFGERDIEDIFSHGD